MPGTRAQSKSRGGAGATSVSAVENSRTADPPGNPSAVELTGNSGQGEMSGAVPTDTTCACAFTARARAFVHTSS